MDTEGDLSAATAMAAKTPGQCARPDVGLGKAWKVCRWKAWQAGWMDEGERVG